MFKDPILNGYIDALDANRKLEEQLGEPEWIVETAWHTVECGDYIGPMKISTVLKGDGIAVRNVANGNDERNG